MSKDQQPISQRASQHKYKLKPVSALYEINYIRIGYKRKPQLLQHNETTTSTSTNGIQIIHYQDQQ